MDGYVALGIMFVLAFAFPVFPLIVAPILQLSLNPLQGIVNGFNKTMQILGYFLIGFAIQIIHENLPFQIAENLQYLGFNVNELLLADNQFLWMANPIRK